MLISDFILQNKHFLEGYSNELIHSLYEYLQESQKEILKALTKPNLNEMTRKHYRFVLAQSIDILKTMNKEMREEVLDSMEEAAKLEYLTISNAIRTQSGLELLTKDIPNYGIPSGALKRILSPEMGGYLLKDYLNKLSSDYIKLIKISLFNGLVQGLGMDDIARNIKRATNIISKDAKTLARTAIMDASNNALIESYKSLSDYIQGYMWLATLDHKTCLVCGLLDGQIYDDYKDFSNIPPEHFNCRCIIVPLTGFDLDILKRPSKVITNIRTTRTGRDVVTTKNVTVSGSENYKDWFERQNKTFQKYALGTTRYSLYSSGRLNIEQFINIRTNKIINIKKLEELYNINLKNL